MAGPALAPPLAYKSAGGRPPVAEPSADPYSPNSPLSPDPHHPSTARRSSFSSSDSRLERYPSRGKAKASTLPSIRSLKTKFLGALGAGSGGGGGWRGPKVVKGEEARKPIRIVSASAMGKGGLKGFSGPAGAPSAGVGGMSRSASTPASLHSLANGGGAWRPMSAELPPPLPLSVDAMLSSAVEAERSPQVRPKSMDAATSHRQQRAVSAPYDLHAIPPHSPSPSPHPPLPLPLPSLAVATPTPPRQVSPIPPTPEPTSPIREPIIRPISADFSRPIAAPSLLSLRKQQQRDSLDVERSLSRSGHRHSRILPGAALPSNFHELQRSKSAGASTAASDEEKRGRHWSAQPPQLHPPLPQLERSSWQGQGSRGPSPLGAAGSTRPPWARRHSAAASGSPSIRGESSPELEEGEKEAHRGRSLSALLGQARSGLGFMTGPKEVKEAKEPRDREKERDRRPSKPFPGGFEEVPYRPSIDATAALLADSVSPTSSSAASFARPLSLPAIVQQHQHHSPRRASQHFREVSFPDTPPPSAKLNHRQSDSSLVVSSRRPSIAILNHLSDSAAIPPLPPSELTLTLQLQLEANPSAFAASTSPLPERTSSLPLRKSKSAIELVPSPFLASAASDTSSPPGATIPLPLHGAGVVHAASPVYDLTAARASVDVQSVPSSSRRGSEEQQQQQHLNGYAPSSPSDYSPPHQRVLSMPDGRTFAQVIEERQRGGRALDSPLSELIEELRSRQNSAANSPRTPTGPRVGEGREREGQLPTPGQMLVQEDEASSEDEEEGDELEGELVGVDSPDFRRKDSQGDGAHPFMLSAYLDSPVSSPAMGKKRRSDPAVPPIPAAFSSPAGSQPSFVVHPSPARTPSSPPLAGAVDRSPSRQADGSLLSTLASSGMDRSLTLEQMEREIAKMEAELALSGRPHSFYDDSTPKAGDIAAFASPAAEPAFAPPSPAPPVETGATTPSLPELGVPLPSTSSTASDTFSPALPDAAIPLDSSTGSSASASSSLADPSSSSSAAALAAQVTPRTARRWSILEIEKAYDRMKRMLGSSSGSGSGVAVPAPYPPSEVQEETEGDVTPASEREAELDVESALDEALAQARGFTGREDGDISSSSAYSPPSPNSKPLPHLPPPTPSPNADRLAASASTQTSESQHDDPACRSSHEQEREPAASTPPTSLPESSPPSTLTVSQKASIDSLIPLAPLSTSRSSASALASSAGPVTARNLAPSPSLDSLRLASSSGHRRKVSDASSTGGGGGGIKKLVLPISNQNRLRTRATNESLRSLSALHSPVEEDFAAATQESPRRYGPNRAGTPLSPVGRRTGPRASSRLSTSGALRSGVGREMQQRLAEGGEEEGAEREQGVPPEDDQLFATSSSGRKGERTSLNTHRLHPPASSLLDSREQRRRSGGAGAARTAGGGTDAASWYPITPSRSRIGSSSSAVGGVNGASVGDRQRSDSQSTASSVALSAIGAVSGRRRTSADEEADEESLESGLEDSEMMANASLNMASIRGMDKLEIFFKYTAVRADLEKAALERDALLDALRETRSTLADIRRQRDSLDAEVKWERQLTRQVKKYLGGDPDRYADKLDNLVESRRAWEARARDALAELDAARDELDTLRREVVDGKSREEQLEREVVMVGARLAAAEMERSEYAGSQPTLTMTGRVPSGMTGLRKDSAATAEEEGEYLHGATPTPSSAARLRPEYDDELDPGRRSISTALDSSVAASFQTARTSDPFLNSSTSSTSSLPPAILDPPSSSALAPPRSHRTSKSSFASLASSSGSLDDPQHLALNGLLDVGSPLMGQTMAFGPKSSFGSTVAGGNSPLKARSAPPAAQTLLPRRGQFSNLRFGLSSPSAASSGKLSQRRPSGSSSNSGSEYDGEGGPGDESFDSMQSTIPSGRTSRLREADEAFLSDLTAEFSVPAGEGSRRGSE
ncbi:hypothetical protein JCM8097_008408 [Rhodosporidiobolus ruineniae]